MLRVPPSLLRSRTGVRSLASQSLIPTSQLRNSTEKHSAGGVRRLYKDFRFQHENYLPAHDA